MRVISDIDLRRFALATAKQFCDHKARCFHRAFSIFGKVAILRTGSESIPGQSPPVLAAGISVRLQVSRTRDILDRFPHKLGNSTRSPQWRAVREQFLTDKVCACCGGRVKLVAHHILPFHVAPESELDQGNLIALCEAEKYGINCHLLMGHLGDFRDWNPLVEAFAAQWSLLLK